MTRSNRSALAVVAALLLVLCPACKKRAEPADGIDVLPVPEAREANGWPRYEVAAEGFAVALPPGWRQFDMTPGKFQAMYAEVTAKNPELAPFLQSVRQQGGGVKFFGFDPETAGTGFATNVNILRQPLPPGVTLDVAVTESVRVLEGLQGLAVPVARERLTLEAGERERLRYRMTVAGPGGRRAAVAITQYLAAKGDGLYIVTMTTLPDQEAGYARTFDGIGRSFRFLK